MDRLPDAYRLLQVDPAAEPAVVSAAFRTLARRYHPDGTSPNALLMAEINRAYSLIRTPEARAAYDARLASRLRPVGPGHVPPRAPSPEPVGVSRSVPPPPASRSPLREPNADEDVKIDFGRYAGWRLGDLARRDPDYVRWLARHSAGLRYRDQIARLLPNEPDLNRRANSVA